MTRKVIADQASTKAFIELYVKFFFYVQAVGPNLTDIVYTVQNYAYKN